MCVFSHTFSKHLVVYEVSRYDGRLIDIKMFFDYTVKKYNITDHITDALLYVIIYLVRH